MNAVYIAAGADVSYGKFGKGDADLLESLGTVHSYRCHIVDKVMYEGVEISSTLIRNAITEGRMEYAQALLGGPYMISGRVAHGRKLGRTIGIPTANVYLPDGKIMGPKGVYYAVFHMGEKSYPATVNVGVKPTVSDDERLCCESYLYNFSQDIYDEEVTIELLKFVRPEMKFGSVDELVLQMNRDISGGALYHNI